MLLQLTQADKLQHPNLFLLLYAGIEKNVLFYLEEQGFIAKELTEIQESIRNVILIA